MKLTTNKTLNKTTSKFTNKTFLKRLRNIEIILLSILLVLGFVLTIYPKLVGLNSKEGLIVYNPVNFREEPSLDSKIIEKINLGQKVRVLSEEENGWVKVKYGKKTGYLVSDSVSMQKVLIDISDFNWGSEYNSIEEFIEFTKRVQERTDFAGYYVQVLRSETINNHWEDIVEILDDMEVPYGLYMYTSSSTGENFDVEYENYKKIISGVDLEYNKYPFMIDLEMKTNQTGVIEYLKETLGDEFIVYANANDMIKYGYHEIAEQYWVAHYGIKNNVPAKEYAQQKGVNEGLAPVIWQYTNEGCEEIFGTNHLDVNIVDEEWYQKYN